MRRWPASPQARPLHSMRALAAMTSHAASAPTDYRALVCVYLQGGNDGHGTLIATDPDSFAAFTQARSGAQGLAYPLNSLLPITPTTPQSGRTFALNPYLTGVQNLFNAGRCALVANTGTLIEPITKDQWNQGTAPLPRRCSHISIKATHGKQLPPMAPTWAGAAVWPTCSRA